MMRTSYSPIFNEALDFSCVIFNTRGDMIGQAEFCPTMLGSAQYAYVANVPSAGDDAIRVAMIYRPSVVTPVGAPMSDDVAINNRAPLVTSASVIVALTSTRPLVPRPCDWMPRSERATPSVVFRT